MATATVLSIQQLSDSAKYKYCYQLMAKLGVDNKQIHRMITKQLLFYFVVPMMVPIIVSIPIILSVANIFTIIVMMLDVWRI